MQTFKIVRLCLFFFAVTHTPQMPKKGRVVSLKYLNIFTLFFKRLFGTKSLQTTLNTSLLFNRNFSITQLFIFSCHHNESLDCFSGNTSNTRKNVIAGLLRLGLCARLNISVQQRFCFRFRARCNFSI